MAKITLNHMFASASGKLCKKESTYISYNKKTGKMYSAEYHGAVQPNSEKQLAVRTKFSARTEAAKTWWYANKPSTTNTAGTEDYQTFLAKYKAQSDYGNKWSYFLSLVDKDLKVKLGSKTIQLSATSSSTESSSSGGSTSGDGVTEHDD